MKKANKQEMELRAGFAADLLAQGHSCTVFGAELLYQQVLRHIKMTQRISPISEVFWYHYVLSTLPAGFEPAAHCLEGSCSIQLS